MSTRDIVYIALFAALTAALGLFPAIAIPLIAVPITAQSMGCMLAGSIAGAKRGCLAMLLFTLLIVIGLPLLAGGRGGFGVLLSPTGGFLLGWMAAAYVIGYLYEKNLTNLNIYKEIAIIFLGGIVVLYCIGIPWIAVAANISLKQAAIGCLAFMPGDCVKVVIVALVAKAVRRGYPTLVAR